MSKTKQVRLFEYVLIPAVERMIRKEKNHQEKLKGLSSHSGSLKRKFMIESIGMLSHLETRLAEYKSFVNSKK
jgi:hypothetical protein